MAQAGFLADNLDRTYPFAGLGPPTIVKASVTTAVPNGAIVDFGALMYSGSGFVAGTHSVALTNVGITLPTLTLTFACDAPDTLGLDLELAVDLPDLEPFLTLRGQLLDADSRVLMEAFVTLGDGHLIDDNFLGDGSAYEVTGGAVEPALVIDLSGRRVDRLNLANLPRTKALAPRDCQPYPTGAYPEAARPVALGLQGAKRLVDGFGVVVTHADRGNAIVLTARPGSGIGWPCGEVPRWEGEAPPCGSRLLSGGPACIEAVRTIGGAVGPEVSIVTGPGFRLRPVPDRDHALELSCDLPLEGTCPDDMIGDDEGWSSSSSSSSCE